MKCLSIKQPWAELIARGEKRLEIRSWQTNYRGPLLIHSSQKPDRMKVFPKTVKDGKIWCEDLADPGELDGFYYLGKVYFTVDLVDIMQFKHDHELDACCPYQPDLFAWKFENVRLIKPISYKGKLNLYEINLK